MLDLTYAQAKLLLDAHESHEKERLRRLFAVIRVAQHGDKAQAQKLLKVLGD